jgi:hypothetical protein
VSTRALAVAIAWRPSAAANVVIAGLPGMLVSPSVVLAIPSTAGAEQFVVLAVVV